MFPVEVVMVMLASTKSFALLPVIVWTWTASLNLVAVLNTICCWVRSLVRLIVESEASESAEEFPELTNNWTLLDPANPGPVRTIVEPFPMFDWDCIQGDSV